MTHWTAIKRVLRYLKGTKDQGIVFRQKPDALELQVYADADFANSQDAKSISGYCCNLGGGCIAWSSKKQSVVALSTTEAEYIALAHASKQLIWLRRLLGEIGINIADSSKLFTDNLSAMAIVHDSTYHARTKHINTAFHFTREIVASNEASLTYVPLKENPADILTKGLDAAQHNYLKIKLGIATSR